MTRTVPQWRDCLLGSSLRSPNHHVLEIKQQIKQRSARQPKRTAGRIRVNLAQLRRPDRSDVELQWAARLGSQKRVGKSTASLHAVFNRGTSLIQEGGILDAGHRQNLPSACPAML
jgi:hypothetical protein